MAAVVVAIVVVALVSISIVSTIAQAQAPLVQPTVQYFLPFIAR
jgi:hypothetical protein